jgi:hypothetical protein
MGQVGEEYEKREQQLIRLNSAVKERQAAARRDKEEAAEREASRERYNNFVISYH